MGSFAVACGWVVLTTRMFAPWLGWWAIVAGAGLVLSRFVWTTGARYAPYLLLWIWMVLVSLQLIRGRLRWGGQP